MSKEMCFPLGSWAPQVSFILCLLVMRTDRSWAQKITHCPQCKPENLCACLRDITAERIWIFVIHNMLRFVLVIKPVWLLKNTTAKVITKDANKQEFRMSVILAVKMFHANMIRCDTATAVWHPVMSLWTTSKKNLICKYARRIEDTAHT